MFMSIMSMSTMCMNGRGCVAFRGEEKDGTEEEGRSPRGWTNNKTREDGHSETQLRNLMSLGRFFCNISIA